MIDLSHVTKRYGGLEAVSDVSFHIGAGEVVGLLGPNGAGKTTLMRVLTCYHLPNEGSATVGSLDVREDPVGVRRLIGYLPENAPLYEDHTVSEYLDFVGASRGLRRSERRTAIERVSGQCGISEELKRPIGVLSKGYRQRVGIAQSLVHSPEVLILDEPTAGLDPNQVVEIRELLSGIGREKTVILSTHILAEAEAICGRVLILNKGRIVAEGRPEEIQRRLDTGARFRVTLRGPIVTREALAAIPRVRSVTALSAEGADSYTAELLVEGGEGGFGELLFDWAVSRGYKLLSSTSAAPSLEELFHALTAEGDRRP